MNDKDVQVPTWAEHQALMAEVRELAQTFWFYIAMRYDEHTDPYAQEIKRRLTGLIKRTGGGDEPEDDVSD